MTSADAVAFGLYFHESLSSSRIVAWTMAGLAVSVVVGIGLATVGGAGLQDTVTAAAYVLAAEGISMMALQVGLGLPR